MTERVYYYCRKARKWQTGKCRHFRCKRHNWLPPNLID